MNKPMQVSAVALGIVFAMTSFAWSQSVNVGKREYDNNCAACHGQDGKGNGPMVGYLTQSPPDLTAISKNNGGVFPFAAVYGVIDGSAEVGAHGVRDMPIWGQEYNAQANENMLGYYYTGGDVEAFVRSRILALIDYIATLQE
jgi:mono/diheme cytochrome c family protein